MKKSNKLTNLQFLKFDYEEGWPLYEGPQELLDELIEEINNRQSKRR